MTILSPEEQFAEMKKKVEESVKRLFPVKGTHSELRVEGVEIDDKYTADDLRAQRKAIVEGRTWSVPVYATFSLRKNGEEVDKKRILLMHVPRMTDRFSFIVDGNEYQATNQFRLKSGVYHRVADNGEIRAHFNLANSDQLANGRGFVINLDPKSAVFSMRHGATNIPIYHLLRGAGVTDEELEKTWGREVLEKNKKALTAKAAYGRFYKAINGNLPENPEEQAGLLASLLPKTRLLPETTAKTLGRATETVDADVLVRSTGNLLGISRGTRQEDDKYSLEFQSIHSIEDLIDDQLRKSSSMLKRKISTNIDKKKSIRAMVGTEPFDKVVRQLFRTSLVAQPEETNPLEFISGRRKTTIMGEYGGIKSSFAVAEDAKLINPSHLGFLDPIHTPEGERTGINVSIPIGVVKKGNELYESVYEAKTGRRAQILPATAMRSTVAFPDQYRMVGGKLKPIDKMVRVSKNGEVALVPASEVDYIIPSPRAMLGVATNLIPFLQNNQGNKAMTAARQQEQAVPLLHREAPLVRVKTDRDSTFEDIIGSYASRKSPVDGEVEQVRSDSIIVKGKDGEKHEVQFYRNFPTRGGTLFDSDVKVKAGDKVKKGDLLADSTFSDDGKLALGTNLHVAYMPFHGWNFDDGVVVSESCAKKLTSLHHYNKSVATSPETVVDRKKFIAQTPTSFSKDQLEGISEDGVVQVGQVVKEGDPLVLVLRKPDPSKLRDQIRKFRRGRPDKYRDASLVWDKPSPGVVTEVVRKGKDIVVYVKTEEPAQVGDKIVGRHGNKGIICRVIPDAEMPQRQLPKGETQAVDMILNPLGVPGRINYGQILETAAGKVAEKTGKPYEVRNFEPGVNYYEQVRVELERHGLTDKESLINPATGKPFEQPVMVGSQYIFKLKHQVQKKMSARSGSGGEGAHYDVNHAPSGGAPHGGQSMGELGLYALLAHGARENIHEMYAYKTSKNDELWNALREGTPIPPPKVPFAYNKFLGFMNAMRVNVRKDGNSLILAPFTEQQVSQLSSGELKEPALILRGKDNTPEAGGLFDEKTTGGLYGSKWSHFKLAEPMPNPIFEEAIKKLTGLNDKQFRDVIAGNTEVKGKRGGHALMEMLNSIDVKKELEHTQSQLLKTKGEKRNKAYQRFRILRALHEQDLKPDVYMMNSVPVLPPVFRPITFREDGSYSNDDINGLYKDIAEVSQVLDSNKKARIPDAHLVNMRTELYDGLRALTGTGGSLTRDYRGIIDILSGKVREAGGDTSGSSKFGYFQKTVMKRRQDFSGRSTIVPEPRQDLDELGLPEEIAWTMYQPFIERELIRQGYKTLDAIDDVRKRSPSAERALNRVVQERPVLLKRDPALHKFNVMAFKPRLVKGKAIEVHPLVTSGFNADFDGDAMSVYLPVTAKGVQEAHTLFPSNNLFSPTSGAVMYTPGQEQLLGLYLLSQPGKRTDKKFKTADEAISSLKSGQIHATDIIRVGGHETTAGRLQIENVLPPEFRETGKKKVSEMMTFDKKSTRALLLQVAKKHPDRYGHVTNVFKDLGNEYSTSVGFSIGLDDFAPINVAQRDKLIREGEARAQALKKKLPPTKAREAEIEIYQSIGAELDRLNDEYMKKHPTNIYRMVTSGSRAEPDQLKQMVSTPFLLMDAKSRVVPYMIPKSYSEGMDTSSYWTTMHGARKGTIQKVQGVRDPGYLSKQIINSTMNLLITEDDCKTTDGIRMPVSNFDVADRYLATGVSLGGKRFRAGDLVTPTMLAAAAKAKVETLPVRSPLRCRAEHGICRHCMGLTEAGKSYDIGTNVGVIAGEAIGEPSTQLALNVFHTSGLAKGRGAKSAATFARTRQVLRLPQNVPNSAPLASVSGTVTRIEDAPQGGSNIYIGDKVHYVPESQKLLTSVGHNVEKGKPLSDGVVNPRELLDLKGIREVQDFIASELYGILSTTAPLKRRNAEVVVKAMTNVTSIEDPGAHPDWVPGDTLSLSQVEHYNATHKDKVKHTPILKGVDVLPTEMQEDWVARMNFQNLGRTLTQASREGWRSNIHGFHPVPAAAHAAEFGRGKERLGEKWKGQY